MYTVQPKKLLILQILDILRKYSDENHRLSQKEIADLLEKEYGVTAERKAVKRNLMDLIEYGYPIEYDEIKRSTANRATGEMDDTSKLSGFYLAHDFSEGELRLLIDGVLSSRQLPHQQSQALIKKLEGLASRHFSVRVRHVRTLPESVPRSQQVFLNIEILDEAISRNRQVEFFYNKYGLDKKLHPKLDKYNRPRRYVVNPFQMAAANGRYYLIGNDDFFSGVAHFRIERISDMHLLETARKPMQDVTGLEKGFSLPRHMAEHIYMFSGESGRVVFRAKRFLLNDVIDWFGTDITIKPDGEENVIVTVTSVNLQAMRMWALQYALYTEMLEPTELREGVKEDIRMAGENYQISQTNMNQ